jgi:DNA-binding GntR family transcriptional regulator
VPSALPALHGRAGADGIDGVAFGEGSSDREWRGRQVPEARYRQVAEDLRQKIESGALDHDTQLPTELELRERYDASRSTIRDAIKLPEDGRVTVFEVRRTAFDQDGQAFRLTVSVYPTDRNQFTINVG